jgi:SAM-dependent methyltransferase
MVFPNTLAEHLAFWGLRRFDSDQEYFQWQREIISAGDLARLAELAQRKSLHADVSSEVAFYDFSVQPRVLPALYSQRYEYYAAVAPLVAARIGAAQTVLDVGCGPGILTTFYAAQFPHIQFVAIDRSAASIATAREQTGKLGLKNVRFECGDIDAVPARGSYDLIVATHAVLQSESDPGLPSMSWQTFERAPDGGLQAEFERRTGLGVRLDHLCSVMAPSGRFLVFEKTRQLSRRVPFQRAFAARGCAPLEAPIPIQYTVVEEIADDGPFYALRRAPAPGAGRVDWDETPEIEGAIGIDFTQLRLSSGSGENPLYENHSASAQTVWAQLPDRRVIKETTRRGIDGKQLHVERGEAQGFSYLYCANTFDQRQLVLVSSAQANLLDEYYEEILSSTEDRMAK